MKRLLHWLLLISFVVTLSVPLTGLIVHKLASAVFLPLCLVHAAVYRRRLGPRRWALLGGVVLAFGSGVLSLVLEELPLVLALHKVISITCVFFLAIHIFVFALRCGRKEDVAV